MLIVGPTLLIMFFASALVLFLEYITDRSKEIRVVHEEQLYNRRWEEEHRHENFLKVDERKKLPAHREPISGKEKYLTSPPPRNIREKEEDSERDSGIV